ncbi:MAG: hypothetical protein WCO07_02580 [bacterium]
MNKKIKTVFQNAKHEPNANLAQDTWQKIIIYNKKITYLKIWTFSIFGALSLVGLVPTFIALANEFSKSGFYEYLALMFSSNGEITSYWKELTLSMAESLPVMAIIYTLFLIFILFLSAKYVTKQIIKNQSVLSY